MNCRPLLLVENDAVAELTSMAFRAATGERGRYATIVIQPPGRGAR